MRKKGTFFIKSRRSKPVLAGFELLSMKKKFKNELEPFWSGWNRFKPVLSGFLYQKIRKKGTFFIKSRMSKPVLAGFELLSMSMKFENELEPVLSGWNRFKPVLSGFLFQKIRRKGTFFIKSRRSKPVLAGFELLSMSMKFKNELEPV
ncbi:hypothetical protein ACJMK2_012682 [Sinanodonta woodiana]|uniref:Uncharacterized protein n=1 Tax=Sinanodonta woodiana TaxID=1069815 RepID=A0ABD3V8Z8_SINWO